MINIRLLKAFPKSAQYIRLNVLFQWLGLLMNVILSASIAYLIASAIEQRPISWIVFVIMILSLCVRMICNDRAVQMSFASSSLVKEQMRERLFSKLSKIGPSYSFKDRTLIFKDVFDGSNRSTQQRMRRSARNVFWQLYSAIFLCVARAADIVFDHTMV